jgi:hypothetical protein
MVAFSDRGVLAGLAGIWYASTQKPVYKSRLSFALDNGGGEGGLSSALNLASQFGIGVGDSKDIFEGDNILEIMKSRRMVERVLLTVDTFAKKPYTLIEFYLYGAGAATSKLAMVHFPVGQGPQYIFVYARQYTQCCVSRIYFR